MDASPLQVWLEHDQRLLRLRLSRPKANIIDAEMIDALQTALQTHQAQNNLQAALLDADGPHFSFGASVEEHLPEHCAEMLRSIHRLIGSMLEFPVPIMTAIQGQCLGGGLEVACASSLLFARPDANLGQPEIQLGVFAPAASCLLAERIGQARTEDLLLSGRCLSGAEAFDAGLVQYLDDDPAAAAVTYFKKHLAPHSAAALRYAVQAARLDYTAKIKSRLSAVETLYLDGLMSTHDAVEGLHAFIDKRPPHWENR